MAEDDKYIDFDEATKVETKKNFRNLPYTRFYF